MRIGRMCVCTCTSRVTSEFFLDSRTRWQQCSWSRGSQEAVISFLFFCFQWSLLQAQTGHGAKPDLPAADAATWVRRADHG